MVLVVVGMVVVFGVVGMVRGGVVGREQAMLVLIGEIVPLNLPAS